MKNKSLCLLATLVGVFYLSLFSCQKETVVNNNNNNNNNTNNNVSDTIVYDTCLNAAYNGVIELDLNGDSINDVRFNGKSITWPGSSTIFSIIELHSQAEILAKQYIDTFYTAYTFSNYGTCHYTTNYSNYSTNCLAADSCSSRVDSFIYPQLFDSVSINDVFSFIPAADSLILYAATYSGQPSFCTSPFDLGGGNISYGSLPSTARKALVVRLNGTELYGIYFSGMHTYNYILEMVVRLN